MIDWRSWCKAAEDFTVTGKTIEVTLPDGRGHYVEVEADDDQMRLSGQIATRGALSRLEQPELWVWRRNRVVSLVGLRIDRYDALIGELRVCTAGLDENEFRTYVRTLAAECDRVELLLTGQDVS